MDAEGKRDRRVASASLSGTLCLAEVTFGEYDDDHPEPRNPRPYACVFKTEADAQRKIDQIVQDENKHLGNSYSCGLSNLIFTDVHVEDGLAKNVDADLAAKIRRGLSENSQLLHEFKATTMEEHIHKIKSVPLKQDHQVAPASLSGTFCLAQVTLGDYDDDHWQPKNERPYMCVAETEEDARRKIDQKTKDEGCGCCINSFTIVHVENGFAKNIDAHLAAKIQKLRIQSFLSHS